jgi:hypothetical protein
MSKAANNTSKAANNTSKVTASNQGNKPAIKPYTNQTNSKSLNSKPYINLSKNKKIVDSSDSDESSSSDDSYDSDDTDSDETFSDSDIDDIKKAVYETNADVRIKFPTAPVIYRLLEYIYGNHKKNSESSDNFFEINDDYLIYKGKNTSSTVFHHMVIKKENLLTCTKNCKLPYRFNPSPGEFKENMKLDKSTSPTIIIENSVPMAFIYDADSNESNKSSSGGGGRIPLHTVSVNSKEPNMLFNKKIPNAVITTNSYKKFCQGLTAQHFVTISVYKKHVILQKGTGAVVGKVFMYNTNVSSNETDKDSDEDEDDEDEDDKNVNLGNVLVNGYISSDIAKNLAKADYLSPNGIIKIYTEPENNKNMIMLRIHIASLGYIETYIILSKTSNK